MIDVIISTFVLAVFMLIIYIIKYLLNVFKLTHYDSYFYSFIIFIALFYLFSLVIYTSQFRSFTNLQISFWAMCGIIIFVFFYVFRKQIGEPVYVRHVLERLIYCITAIFLANFCVYFVFALKLQTLIMPTFMQFMIFINLVLASLLGFYKYKYQTLKIDYHHSNFILGFSIYIGIFLAVFSTYAALDYLTIKETLYPTYSNQFDMQHNYQNIFSILSMPGNIDNYVFLMTFGKFIEGFFFIQAVDYMAHYADKKNHKVILTMWLAGIFLYMNMFTFNPFTHMETALLKAGPSYIFLQFNIFFPMLVVLSARKTDVFKYIILFFLALSIDMFTVYLYIAYLVIISFVELRFRNKRHAYQVLMLALTISIVVCVINHTAFVPYPIMYYQALLFLIFLMLIVVACYLWVKIDYLIYLQEVVVLAIIAYQLLYSYPVTMMTAYFYQKPIYLYWIEKPWLKFSYPLVEHISIFITSDMLAMFFIIGGFITMRKSKATNIRRLSCYMLLAIIILANPLMYSLVGNLYILNANYGYMIYTRVFMMAGFGLMGIYGCVFIYNNYIAYKDRYFQVAVIGFFFYTKVYSLTASEMYLNPNIIDYRYLNESVKAFKIQDPNVMELLNYPFKNGDRIFYVDNIINPYFERFWIDSTSIGKLDNVATYREVSNTSFEYNTYIVVPKYANNFQLDASSYLVTDETVVVDESYNYYLRIIDQEMLTDYSNLYYDKGFDVYNTGGLLEDLKGGVVTNETPIN